VVKPLSGYVLSLIFTNVQLEKRPRKAVATNGHVQQTFSKPERWVDEWNFQLQPRAHCNRPIELAKKFLNIRTIIEACGTPTLLLFHPWFRLLITFVAV